jgi:hypothetical protein
VDGRKGSQKKDGKKTPKKVLETSFLSQNNTKERTHKKREEFL